MLTGAAALALVTAARPAVATCAVPRHRRLVYAMRVGGVQVAEIELVMRCAGSFAVVEMAVDNRGIASLFAGRNITTMTALVAFDGEDPPMPARFRASYQKPDRLRETELDFAPDGHLVHLVTRNQGRD
jgi:hypothetical protein